MSVRCEHHPLPSTGPSGGWHHQLMALAHVPHDGAHRDCIVYVVHSFEPTAWDAMAYDVADRIHMRRHPDSSVHLGGDIARIVMSHTIADMQSAMVERGAAVADIHWEMQRSWVDYVTTVAAAQGHRVVRNRPPIVPLMSPSERER